MNTKISLIIQTFSAENIAADRKDVLASLIAYTRDKQSKGQAIRLNFICTHNSRRSHL